jgi:hypothetical protein
MPVDPLDFSRVQARILYKKLWPHMCNQFGVFLYLRQGKKSKLGLTLIRSTDLIFACIESPFSLPAIIHRL